MDINLIANTIAESGAVPRGTGGLHKSFDLDNMIGGGIALLKRGTALPAELTQTSLRALQAERKLIILQNVFGVEDQSADDQFETAESGREALATKGLHKYTATFTNGLMFNTVIASLEGNNRWEVIVFDGTGNVKLRKTPLGEYRGFTTSHTTLGKPTMKSGGTTAKQAIVFQLSRRNETDEQIKFFESDKLEAAGVSFLDLEGINEMEVSLNPLTVGDTTVTGRIVSRFDGVTTATGLAEGDLSITGDLTPTNVTITDEGAVTFTIPAATLDDEFAVEIDGVFENANNDLFQSNKARVIATA